MMKLEKWESPSIEVIWQEQDDIIYTSDGEKPGASVGKDQPDGWGTLH